MLQYTLEQVENRLILKKTFDSHQNIIEIIKQYVSSA